MPGRFLYAFGLGAALAASLETSANATYKLYEDGDGICSVQFIGNNDEGALFLTAAHCVDDSMAKDQFGKEKPKHIYDVRVEVQDPKTLDVIGERIFYLKPLRVRKVQDVALLITRESTAGAEFGAPIDLATVDEANSVKFGDDLVVLGFPAAQEKTITKGQFTKKIQGVLDLDFNYQTNIPIAGGNSGGGLYANFPKDGVDNWKLIGTASASRRDNSIMSYFSVSEAIKDLLAGYIKAPVSGAAAPKSPAIDER